MGPQQTLYLPGCWLNRSRNEIVIFEMLKDQVPHVAGIKTPILDDMGEAETTIHS